MKQTLRIETFYVKPPVNTDEILDSLDWYRRDDRPVQADLTDWNVSQYFPDLCNQVHVLYPNHKIQDLWVASYGRGDYAETHNHSGFDLSFAWFVDSCPLCTPLVFPNTRKLWMPPVATYTPEVGTLLVFSGQDNHYVPPHTCRHKRVVISGNAQLINTETTRDPWLENEHRDYAGEI